MGKGIEIKRAFTGYTAITYNGTEIAKHHLSATSSGTREAFNIPENESIDEWFEKKYSEEIQAIEKAEQEEKNNLNL